MKMILAWSLMIAATAPAMAAWCDPPIPPLPTSDTVAREFREEITDQFEAYFRETSRYTTCLEDERTRVIEEMRATALRYERILEDVEAGPVD